MTDIEDLNDKIGDKKADTRLILKPKHDEVEKEYNEASDAYNAYINKFPHNTVMDLVDHAKNTSNFSTSIMQTCLLHREVIVMMFVRWRQQHRFLTHFISKTCLR